MALYGFKAGNFIPGAPVFTDEYGIYGWLCEWGYEHKSVCHSWGEYARDDDDGDGLTTWHPYRAKNHMLISSKVIPDIDVQISILHRDYYYETEK